MKQIVFVAALTAISVATPAVAQDQGDATFTGPRVEFHGGYNRTLPDRKTSGPVNSSSQTPRHTGGIAGVQAGYDMQLGPLVVGAFGGYAYETSNACGTLTGTNLGCLRPQRQIEGGVRAGAVFADRFLVYGKGAYVNSGIRTTVRDGSVYRNSHINRDGWRVGGGAEFALNSSVYVKAEYDYSRTERFSAAPYGFPNTTVSYHQHSVLGGVGVRF